MKLLFLHGPPASGKYTIARVLHESYGFLNFHNHLTIDVAKSLFDFGTAEFWDLTHRLRRTAVAAIADQEDARVVFTNCYSSPQDDATIVALEHEVTSRNGDFVPVFLECTMAELRRRVTAPSRARMQKIQSIQGLDDYVAASNFVPLDRPNTFSVNTEGRTPEACAEEIHEQLD